MTRAQNMIVNYINQQFVPGSVTIIPVGESHVKITDKNKESLTFTVNIFSASPLFSARVRCPAILLIGWLKW